MDYPHGPCENCHALVDRVSSLSATESLTITIRGRSFQVVDTAFYKEVCAKAGRTVEVSPKQWA